MKVSVVGMGRVGGATAFSLVVRGVPHELVLVGRNPARVAGDAHDLQHAAAFVRPMRILPGTLADAAGSDIILLCLSAPETFGNRLDSAGPNAQLLAEVVPPLAASSPEATFVVLTNPVDIATYVTLQISGFPPGRVLGTGTLIDTARFRALLGRATGINAHDIRAYILGEHGDSQFPALSVASAGGEPLALGDRPARALFEESRLGGHVVARAKGYTNYAVALAATLICEAIADDSRVILPVSTLVNGFLGVRDVCLSLPCIIGRRGIVRPLAIDLDDHEADQFRQGAALLRGILDRLPPLGPAP